MKNAAIERKLPVGDTNQKGYRWKSMLSAENGKGKREGPLGKAEGLLFFTGFVCG